MPQPSSRPTSLFLPLLLVASPALAQQTWIVDPTGAGNFTDLPAAIAGAAAGDTLLVRPGSYSSATIDKPLQVLGAGSASVDVYQLNVGPWPAGQAVLAGMTIDTLSVRAPASLDGLRFYSGGITASPVTLQSCVWGHPFANNVGLWVGSGDVVIQDCIGAGAQSGVWVTRSCQALSSHPALVVAGGTVTVANSIVRGVDSAPVFCPYFPLNGYPSHAVELTGGTLTVTASMLVGGLQNGTRLAAVTAPFAGDPSTVILPPSTAMTPIFLPATGGDSASPGGAIACRIETLPGTPAILAAGLGMRAPVVTPFGSAWIDPSAYVILRWGVTDASGRMTALLSLPQWVPLGLPLTVQGVAVSPAGQFELGAPVIVHVL